MTDEVDDFLAHFGVKGQKWGVIREEDGTTGRVTAKVDVDKTAVRAAHKAAKIESRDAKREARGQKFDAKAQSYQQTIDKISSTKYNSRSSQKQAQQDIADFTKLKERAVADAERKRQGKLSSNEKKVVIGAAVVATLIAAKVVSTKIESGEFTALAAKGRARMNGTKATDFARKEYLKNPNMSADLIHKVVIPDINPDYGRIGSKMNCRRCTFAYEMRRRGYDVAATKTTKGTGQTALGLLNAVSPGEKIKSTGVSNTIKVGFTEAIKKELNTESGVDVKTPFLDLTDALGGGAKTKIPTPSASSIFDVLGKQPDGSRGELAVNWTVGGGHSMAYEIIRGKPVVFDAQTGAKLANIEELAKHGLDKISNAGFTRLDNIPLNEEYLLRWLKNAK